MTNCSFCGLTYLEDLSEDRRIHRRLHRLAIPWVERYPWLAIEFRQRETIKADAWKHYRESTAADDLPGQVQAADQVMRMHYSRTIAGSFNPRLPSLETYASAYLAQPHVREFLFTPAVCDSLAARYRITPTPSPHLPNGKTGWRMP